MSERNEVTFEIVEHIGIIKQGRTGWNQELNIVAWNGGEPRYDIREWKPDHTRMSRGITFTHREMDQLRGLMNAYDRRTNLTPRNFGNREDKER